MLSYSISCWVRRIRVNPLITIRMNIYSDDYVKICEELLKYLRFTLWKRSFSVVLFAAGVTGLFQNAKIWRKVTVYIHSCQPRYTIYALNVPIFANIDVPALSEDLISVWIDKRIENDDSFCQKLLHNAIACLTDDAACHFLHELQGIGLSRVHVAVQKNGFSTI